MNIFGRNSKIMINGKSYSGNNITINDGVVIVDGEVQEGTHKQPMILVIECNVDKIVSSESIHITGDVHGNIEAEVNVDCDDVYGNVKAKMNANCDNVTGNVDAGMTINCDDIYGDAKASIINR